MEKTELTNAQKQNRVRQRISQASIDPDKYEYIPAKEQNDHVKADQYFAVLTNTRSVGVVGDFRTFDYTIALRAVRTSDFMTCEYAPIPHKTLSHVAARIVNEVSGAGRVVYDITGKPPATIEWE